MTDFSHLNAIQERLFRNEQRLKAATTERDRLFYERQVEVDKREEAAEYKFLGIEPAKLDDISDDDLFSELSN